MHRGGPCQGQDARAVEGESHDPVVTGVASQMPGSNEPIEQFQLTVRVPPGVRNNPAALKAFLQAMAHKLAHNDAVDISEAPPGGDDPNSVSITMMVRPCGAR